MQRSMDKAPVWKFDFALLRVITEASSLRRSMGNFKRQINLTRLVWGGHLKFAVFKNWHPYALPIAISFMDFQPDHFVCRRLIYAKCKGYLISSSQEMATIQHFQCEAQSYSSLSWIGIFYSGTVEGYDNSSMFFRQSREKMQERARLQLYIPVWRNPKLSPTWQYRRVYLFADLVSLRTGRARGAISLIFDG